MSLSPIRRSHAGGQGVLRESGVVRSGVGDRPGGALRWRGTYPPISTCVSAPPRKTLRPLKPRTPHDCPACGRPHPTPIVGNVRKPGVLPWRERKRARHASRQDYLHRLIMLAPTRSVTITATPVPPSTLSLVTASAMRMASNGSSVERVVNVFPVGVARRCMVSTRRPQVAQVMLAINQGLTIADVALLFHQSEVTLRLWLSRAGQHAEQVHAHFFQNLTLGHVQLDELP